MSDNTLVIRDRLEDILESIGLILEWSKGRASVNQRYHGKLFMG